MNIPFTKPYWGKTDERAVVEALRHSNGIGDGPYSQRLVGQLKKLLGVKFVYPVTSCTHALDLAMAVLGVGPGDEVIVPSYTLSSTANCVVLRGGTPVFADIEEETYGIDPKDVERVITKKTRGIAVVHYAGMPCKIDEILAIAKKYKLFVVEDAAHAIGASYKHKPLGTFGEIGAFSFHGTKNVCSGEGGIAVTEDEQLSQRMDIFRAAGTNRSAFMRHEVALYTWVGEGTSFYMSDILAALIDAQLTKLTLINTKRMQVAHAYHKALRQFEPFIQLPQVPKHALPNWHIYALRFRQAPQAQEFLTAMRNKGIGVSTHFVPLHSSPMGRKISGKRFRRLPVTEQVARTLIRLPIYPSLTQRELSYITTSAQATLNKL